MKEEQHCLLYGSFFHYENPPDPGGFFLFPHIYKSNTKKGERKWR